MKRPKIETRRLNATIPLPLFERLERVSELKGITMPDIARRAFEMYLEEEEAKLARIGFSQ